MRRVDEGSGYGGAPMGRRLSFGYRLGHWLGYGLTRAVMPRRRPAMPRLRRYRQWLRWFGIAVVMSFGIPGLVIGLLLLAIL